MPGCSKKKIIISDFVFCSNAKINRVNPFICTRKIFKLIKKHSEAIRLRLRNDEEVIRNCLKKGTVVHLCSLKIK
jgi:hypothetical protein